MLPQRSRASTVVFGPFQFDPESSELRKHGYRIKLGAQPAIVLAALLEPPGELVNRETLRGLLWPGAIAGDFEHGVNAAVNKLRQALGDAARQPRYIETLPGTGYRFLAPVRPLGATLLEVVAPPGVSPPPLERRAGLPLWIRTAAVAAVAAGLLGASWMVFRRPGDRLPRATQFAIRPPQGYYLEAGGVRQGFALSPDGARIAFTAKEPGGGFRLFVRDFSELESRPVVDGDGAYSVVWSPDGKELLFTSKGKLRRATPQAAASQVLSDSVPYFTSAVSFGVDRLLVSSHRNSGVIPSSGGTVQPIDRPFPWAQMLPGGRHFLFSTHDASSGRSIGRIATAGGIEPGVEVVQADSRVQYTASLRGKGGYLLYLRGGTLLAQPFDPAERRVTGEPKAVVRRVPSFGPTGSADFSVSERGVLAYQTHVARSEFLWVDRNGKRLSVVSPPDITANYARLSPDGRWLASAAFDVEHGVPEIWLYDATDGAGRRILFGGRAIRALPVWSPDSRRLAYLSDENWPRLAISSLDGKADETPLPNTGFMAPSDWSADGRFILYTNAALPAITTTFPADVFAVDMQRNRKVIPLLESRFHETSAVFSPDGNLVAFLSNESGRSEAYVQMLDRGNDSLRVKGDRVLVSRDGAQSLRWRKDGRELFYLGSDGRVHAVSMASSPSRVEPGRPEPLFLIDGEARASIHSNNWFDVSPDGSRFVVPSMVPGESSALIVLQDWETLVK